MDLFLQVLVSSTATTLLIGALGFLFRSQITHWLNRDLEAIKNRYALDLESTKDRYAKELETHKLSLMGDAERIKAAQEVRKASAIWVVERKYKSYMDALDSVVGLGAEIGSSALIYPQHKTEHTFQSVCDRVEKLKRARLAAAPFLNDTENDMLDKLFAHCLPIIPHCRPGTPIIGESEKRRLFDPLFDVETELEIALFARIEALSNL